MKKILALMLTLAMLLCIPVAAAAAKQGKAVLSQPKVLWNADGSRMESALKVLDPTASSYAAKTKYIRTAEDTYEYYDLNGDLVFTYTLTVVFEYDGAYVKVKKAWATYTIIKDGWKKVSSKVTYPGNTAYAEAVFIGNGEYIYPIISISCDCDGNIFYSQNPQV